MIHNNQLIAILFCLALTFQFCKTCDVISYFLPISVQSTIDQNTISRGESFEINIDIPNEIIPTKGMIQNIELEEFEIGITFQKFVSGEIDNSKNPYLNYENALNKFNINIIEGESLENGTLPLPFIQNLRETSLIIKPERNSEGRQLKLKITPLVEDTFVIHFVNSLWDSNRDMKDCSDLNYFKFENNEQDIPEYVTKEFVEFDASIREQFQGEPRNIFNEYDGGTFLIVN